MADLLLELFSEEIPARMQDKAAYELELQFQTKIIASGLLTEKECQESDRIWSYVTPRRLALSIKNLPTQQSDISTELKGPKIDAPQAAIDGFLKKSGMTLGQLIKQDGIYIAKIEQKGKPTAEILKPLIEDILKNFPWPKSMRWGANETSWVRPLHSILCIFDGKVVPVEFAGVKASNTTRGHRFLAPATITIHAASDYEAALEKAFVIADREKRKAEIRTQAAALASTSDLRLKTDDYLLEEVTGLVEWPTVLMGTIDKNYMDLPPEVLVSEMRAHQKYFALYSSPIRGEAGRGASGHTSVTQSPLPNPPPNGEGIFSDKFLITSNMTASDGGKAITLGNERVLRARLADGRFFWDTDRKKKLEDWAKGLNAVTYHAKLGSVADKVERIKKLSLVILSEAKNLCKDPSHTLGMTPLVERAAGLCKADLTTGMVGEFPDLQGVMGRYYATQQGEKPEVADAIRDHYKPQGPADGVPTAPVAVCVALADKLDTLISMFAIGEKPTGSKDPFALRRAALGIIRIVLENNLRLPLLPLFKNAPLKEIALHKAHEKLVEKAEAALAHETHKVGKYVTINETASQDIPETALDELSQSLLAFFHDRLIVQLKESGIRHDVIKAVIAGGDDDLVRIVARAKAVQAFLETDDGKNLLAGYKRAANIVAIEEKKDKTSYAASELDRGVLVEAEEKRLIDNLVRAQGSFQQAMLREAFAESVQRLGALRSDVDAFFEKILVNCENKELRVNRLRLLASIRDCMNDITDFSLIEGDSKEQKKAA